MHVHTVGTYIQYFSKAALFPMQNTIKPDMFIRAYIRTYLIVIVRKLWVDTNSTIAIFSS